MLMAVRYHSHRHRTEAESQYVHLLASAWKPPSATILHHYHFVTGGGVVYVEIEEDVRPLIESLEPFRPFVDFDVEPVLNMAEAVAIALNVDEWKASVLARTEN